ncbi:hypothetical protein N0V93_005074 [Gnomoniopsis smithogilvyi]|uniref:Oxidoreductase n=1 Tax=Gnomoniopsis smithogilvyi TaxID=1191159 RepID=A0A9W9CWD8_9PEZI|nr:hypothetical protein N0V93_005074 [Gnomoniopsis smithogilvyi]
MQLLLLTALLVSVSLAQNMPSSPIRVAIVGLVHGHVAGILPQLNTSRDAQLIGISEPNTTLAKQYADDYHLAASLFYTDMETMLTAQAPDAVLVYTTILDHRRTIEVAATHGIHAMVEKPLSTTLEDALAIRQVSRKNNVHVLTNYETTWYPSNTEALRAVHAGDLGTIRKTLVYDGHMGPAEIGVGPEWLPWLTDPVQNGAGALFDFGCYGADLATVLHRGAAPKSVTAMTATNRPGEYPLVDDDATVVLQYEGSQAIIVPSWSWTYNRKDMEVYGTNGSVRTVGSGNVTMWDVQGIVTGPLAAPPLPAGQNSSLAYLRAVLREEVVDEGDLSALDTNLVVMQILEAARESARTEKTLELTVLPP